MAKRSPECIRTLALHGDFTENSRRPAAESICQRPMSERYRDAVGTQLGALPGRPSWRDASQQHAHYASLRTCVDP